MTLKLIYVTLYPEKYPRIEKIRNAIKNRKDVILQALIPKVRIRLGNNKYARVCSALINYSCYIIQILLAKADLYWVTTSPDVFVIPIILKRQDYILEYRNPSGLETEIEFGRLGVLAERLERIALKYSKAVTLTTSTLAKRVEPFQKKVFVIPNYPQKETFKNSVSAEEFRSMHDVKRNEKIVLFVGRLSKSEGFDILPGMIKGLSKHKEGIVFWIIGDGPLSPIAKELEREYPKKVRFFGWQPYEQIPNFINSADVCIAPRPQTPTSDYCNEEGIHKISEYMLYRKPIVACGISQSKQYMLVEQQDMVKGILEALEGRAPKATPRSWEDDCVGTVLEVIKFAEAIRR